MTARATACLGLLLLPLFGSACSTVAPLKTADPTPAGGREWLIGYSVSLVENCDSVVDFDGVTRATCNADGNAPIPNFMPDFGLRVGLGDDTDLGFRLFSGASVDLTLRLLASDLVSIAINPTFHLGGIGLGRPLDTARAELGVLTTWHLRALDLTASVAPFVFSHPRYNSLGYVATLGFEYAWEPGFFRMEVSHTDYTSATWERTDPLEPVLKTTTIGIGVGWRFGGR